MCRKVAPIGKLLDRPISTIIDDIKDDGKLNNSNSKQQSPQVSKNQLPNNQNNQNNQDQQQKGIFNNINPNMNNYGNQFGGYGKDEVKWKIFLRDFITWLIIVTLLYLVWKHFLHPIKMKGNINVPSTNTQYFPMGIGKVKN